jgi:hypothetical protein
MKTQLVDRYLKDNDCHHGIYLVGWYICDQWDDRDYRKKHTPNWSLQEARDFFQQQADDLSENNRLIHAVVINAALR